MTLESPTGVEAGALAAFAATAALIHWSHSPLPYPHVQQQPQSRGHVLSRAFVTAPAGRQPTKNSNPRFSYGGSAGRYIRPKLKRVERIEVEMQFVRRHPPRWLQWLRQQPPTN